MQFKTHLLLLLSFFLVVACANTNAQTTQTIKGLVTDSDTQQPLIGAAIYIPSPSGDALYGGTTDIDGRFKIEDVPVGRHTVKCSFLGYEEWIATNIFVTSGKEVVLNVELLESVITGEAVVITAKHEKDKPLNQFSIVSTRAFSVEDVQRTPASINDPGRMALSFAGVRQANQDNENSFVIRSNSPVGVSWRLEGVDIPNPNHFAHRGSSGGGISGLSVNVLGDSDFSTGAFPAEYGNAFAGVMDLKFRKGNTEKREFRIQAGVVGLDAMFEGPISKEKGSSYLVNYRYSTLSILGAMGISVTQPNMSNNFQDLSFNVYFPAGKKSYLNVWGLGAYSTEKRIAIENVDEWEQWRDKNRYDFITRMGVMGITHTQLLNDKAYLKTVVSLSSHALLWDRDTLNNELVYGRFLTENITKNRLAVATAYNHKYSARFNLKTGLQATALNYNLSSEEWDTDGAVNRLNIDGKGTTAILQPYAQARYRPNESLTFNFGLHALYLALNNSIGLDPRLAAEYRINPQISMSLAYGLHSMMQPIANYFLTTTNPNTGVITSYPNKDLGFNKAHHFIVSYNHLFPGNIRLKLEPYYQHLFNIPVATNPNSTYYALNGYDEFARPIPLVNEGTADHYGIDLTFEKFFSKGLFFMLSGSLYDATYVAPNGKRYDTRYNGTYNSSIVLGKEFTFKKNRSLEIGAKFFYSGGRRYTPIDTALSAQLYQEVSDDTRPYTAQLPDYYRLDMRFAYRKNKPNYYWMLSLDLQNATNKLNEQNQEYDPLNNVLTWRFQSERIPALSFTVDF